MAADGGDVATLDDGGDEEPDFVDEVALEGLTESVTAPFDQDAGNAALPKFLQNFPERHSGEDQGAGAMSIGQEF